MLSLYYVGNKGYYLAYLGCNMGNSHDGNTNAFVEYDDKAKKEEGANHVCSIPYSEGVVNM